MAVSSFSNATSRKLSLHLTFELILFLRAHPLSVQLMASNEVDHGKKKNSPPGISFEAYMKQLKEAEIDQKTNKLQEDTLAIIPRLERIHSQLFSIRFSPPWTQ